ncbi:MAG TPA: Imm1 family immunity protein [Xanthobacteraceae bacterium]|jgi:hypothetical protein|nr:Imm1 family immunity protein [Xanthobacteraceae bacterium]
MRKRVYFDVFNGAGWPSPNQLEPYFLAPPGQRWTFDTGNDSWGLYAEDVDGPDHLEANKDGIDVGLMMWGHPDLGVLLIYSKWGGGFKNLYSSKGDLSRLREWVRSTHETPLPVGLFIPYAIAWRAVKEFIETDGKLPKSIEWIANKDLPKGTFPDP